MSYITKLFNTPFFQNKFVLYGSLLLVLLSILRHLANRNVNAVVLMALIGLVMSYFSKNMIIVLLTAFATVFLLEMTGSQGVMEGMENKKKKEDDTKPDDKEDDETPDEAVKDEKPKTKGKVEVKPDEKDKKTEGNTPLNAKKTNKANTKQGLATLSPASYDGKDHDDNEGESASGAKGSSSKRIDYAATLEQAYDNIETIIGEEGVRGLTDQTKSLMNQQKELMNNMKEMGPLLKSAEGFMEQLTGGGGISGITSMLKGFATPGGAKKQQ
jgi:hypothetical protein